MSYIDDIQAIFDAHADIADYRINISERRSLGIGIRDNDVGSVYSPFSFSASTSGGFLVQWQDQRLSRGNLDGNSLSIIDQMLANARQAAYDDPDAAQFLEQPTVQHVPLFSEDIPPLFRERTEYLLEIVKELQGLAARYEAKTLNGGVGVSMSQSWLRTSRGLALGTNGTNFSYSGSFDGIIGEGKSQRTVAPLDAISDQIALAGDYLQQLRTPASGIANGTRLVVLHPDVAYSMFNFFVWGNLGGSAIFHGQSPFCAEDFRDQKQVFRDDLTVRVEPWQPLGIGSFAYTTEGLPSAPNTYIDRGRLTQPILDLKYARRLNLPPTTPPGNEESVVMQAADEVAWDQLQPQLDEAILVLSVLGLHTQDRTSGNYSLSTSQALLIRDGAVQGRIKATLNGNLFDNLRDAELRLVRFPGQHSAGFALPVNVAIEQV
ncbi:MAG TPA: metallopeptidase TldD-related protein [Herpetosiphonaceae bacterium]